MKQELLLKERVKLLEKELNTLTDKLEKVTKEMKEMEDLKNQIKGLKLFFGRIHPEFKTKFPGIMQKVFKKK